MKLLTVCFLSAIMAVFFGNAQAQVAFSSIQGKVVTDAHTPAESATIILLKARDSSIISSTIIGKNGRYRFDEVPPDSYLLLATSVGYVKSYAGPYELGEDKILKVSEIVLKSDAHQLKEVVISSTRPQVEVRPGKIILNIPGNLTAEGSSALEILKQSPGVRVDNNNNISIMGKQSALVTIDGKTTSLSGDDLVAYLRSLQSNVIERIELITAGSAKYDASGGGIVNIITKKGNGIGANGTVTATAGYGKYYKSNVGVTFNDRMDKFNVFGGYNFTADKTFHNFTNNRVIVFNNVLSNYDVDYNSTQQSTNNSFNVGTDFFISPKHTIGFLINGLSRQDDYNKNNTLSISNRGVLDSIITANSDLSRSVNKVNYNLNYSGKLDKAGTTLTADINYTTFNRSSAEYITNDFYDTNHSPYRDPLLLANLSPSKIRSWLSKLDFSTPLSKTSTLETGFKNSHVSSNNDLVFGPKEGDMYTADPRLSNHFYYTENINAAYVNFQSKFNKVELVAGLRGEQTSSTGNSVTMNASIVKNYFDLFPQALLTYHKNENNDFSLSYNRGITRPAYEEINPFLYYVDLYDFRSGNPGLKPEYSNNIELTHTYKKILTTTLYALILNNASDFGYDEQNDSTKINIKTRVNFGKIYTYGFKVSAPVTFTAWWNAYLHADVSYQRYIAYPQYGNLDKGTQDVILNVIQNFRLSPTVSAMLSGDYESPTFYGINQNKARYWVDAGIGTQLFNKRGSLRFSITDVFNTERDRQQINYQNLNMVLMDKTESQVARLTFTYHFGKTSVKAAAVHPTGNEEQQKRIGGSGGGN